MGLVVQVSENPPSVLPDKRDFLVDAEVFHEAEHHGRGLERQGAALEVKAFTPEASRVSSGCDVGFEDGDFVAFFSQKIAGCQTPHTRTDDGDSAHGILLPEVGSSVSRNREGVKWG